MSTESDKSALKFQEVRKGQNESHDEVMWEREPYEFICVGEVSLRVGMKIEYNMIV